MTKKDRESRSANTMKSSFVYRYRGFNCRKKQFSRSYRNNLNSAWKKINAACLPFITNVFFPTAAFGMLSRSAKCEHGDAIQRITVRFRVGEGKGGEEMGMRQGTIIVAAMRSFFLSRVMLSFPRCVCYSTVKEYRFCTSQ